jgi:hypothetical protein
MRLLRLPLTALLALGTCALVSCGDDAAVTPAGAAGSTGSTESTATTGSGTGGGGTGGTGSGGQGGSAPTCERLVQTGALAKLPSLPGSVGVLPTVHSLGNGDMAVVHMTGGPGSGKAASTSIAWTADWPPVASPAVELHDATLYAAPRSPSTSNGIALLAQPEAGIGLAFGFGDPVLGGWSEQVTTHPDANQAAFLAQRASDSFFAGAFGPGPDIYSNTLHVGWVTVDGGAASYVGPLDLGCVDFRTADAVATPDGWLLAHGWVDCAASPPAPLAIRVTRFVDGSPQIGAEIETFGQVQRIVLVPRAAGAWLLYWQSTALQAVRLDALGQVELGPVAIVPMSQPYPFSADALGGGLVVAHGHDGAGLTAVVFDEQLVALASAEAEDVPDTATPQIAFDAETRQMLVALHAFVDGVSAVRAARFSCQ